MSVFGGEFSECCPCTVSRRRECLGGRFSSANLGFRELPFRGLGDSSATGESMVFQNPVASESNFPPAAVGSVASGIAADGILARLVEISLKGPKLVPVS